MKSEIHMPSQAILRINAFSSKLTSVLLFIEAVNSQHFQYVVGSEQVWFEKSIVAVRNNLKAIVENNSVMASDFSQSFASVFPEFKLDIGAIDRFIEEFIAPDKLELKKAQHSEYGVISILKNKPAKSYPSVQKTSRKFESKFYSFKGDGLHFTNRPIEYSAELQRITESAYRSEINVVDELIDPVYALQNFVISELDINRGCADHFLQAWIKDQFDIKVSNTSKAFLHAFVGRFDAHYFGAELGKSMRMAEAGKGFSSFSFVTSKISDLYAHKFPDESNEVNLLRSMGIFLFLRFAKSVRTRFFLLTDDFLMKSSTCDGQGRGWRVGQIVSAVRPLESTYFQARVHGAIPGIRGLSFIFRGGMLPYAKKGRSLVLQGKPGTGKTNFALHFVADMAYRGRLAIYVSLEESYETILDRLVTFGYLDRRRFQVANASAGLESVIKYADPNKGLLLFFDSSQSTRQKFNLDVEISRLLKVEGVKKWPWRAIVIDSVNGFFSRNDESLPVSSQASLPAKLDSHYRYRSKFVNIIKSIEDGRFFGILVSETFAENSKTLPHLSDAVISLTRSDDGLNRYIEIRKCRSQYFHPGRHPFTIRDGRGVSIYPSLEAVHSTLRLKGRNTLSVEQSLALPTVLQQGFSLPSISGKSITLIHGSQCPEKGALLWKLLLKPSVLSDSRDHREVYKVPASKQKAVEGLIVYSFRLPESRLLENLRSREMQSLWNSVLWKRVRWFSPGENFTAEQIVSEIMATLLNCRRQGISVSRIAFLGIESSVISLPKIGESLRFWRTVFDLVTSEPLTVFLHHGGKNEDSDLFDFLCTQSDYRIEVRKKIISEPIAVVPDNVEESQARMREEAARVFATLRKAPLPPITSQNRHRWDTLVELKGVDPFG